MNVQEGALQATATEITAVSENLGLRRGSLSILSEAAVSPRERQEAARAFNALDAPSKKRFTDALKALNAPGKVVHLRYDINAGPSGRMLLSWSPAVNGSLAALAAPGDAFSVTFPTREALQDLLSGFLGADLPIREDRVNVPLSTESALALLAVCDHLRREDLASMLNHQDPRAGFTSADLKARFADASAEDDRWCLNFLEKVLPIPMGKLAVAQDPTWALAELERLGLVDVAQGAEPPRTLTEHGRLLADSINHDVSKVGLTVTVLTPDRLAAQDVAFFLRTPEHLLCFYFSGAETLVTALGPRELQEITAFLLGPVPVPPEQPPLPVGEGMEATIVPGAQLERTMVEDATIDLVPLCLRVESGAGEGRTYVLVNGGTMGRAPDNDIVITDPGVSRKHASFTRSEAGAWIVSDLGSSNGTYVNEAKIKEPTAVGVGDEVRVCNTTLRSVPATA